MAARPEPAAQLAALTAAAAGAPRLDEPTRATPPRWLIWAALTALTGYGVWARWRLLGTSPYPLGVDGYFYPIQLRSLLEHGQLYYPASPLAFWLMAPLAALTDPILGAKLGVTLAGAAVVWPAYAVGARLARGGARELAGLTAAVVAVSSTGSLLLAAEFIKNAFGVTVGLTALAGLLACAAAPSRRRLGLAALAVLAALLTHKMATALALSIGAPPLLLAAGRQLPSARRGRLALIAAVGLIAGALLALGALAPGRFLALDHLTLLRGLFAGPWRWDAPALAVGTYVLPLGGEGWMCGAVCAVAAVLTAVRCRRDGARGQRGRPPVRLLASLLALGLGAVVAWPGLDVADPQGLGFRLRLIAFVPLALGAAVLCDRALASARGARIGRAVTLVALAGWLWRAPTTVDRGVVYAHPAMVSAVYALASAVPAGDTVVVSERHLAFMATWYTRAITTVHADAGPPERRWRLLPLAFIGLGTPLAHAIEAARVAPELVAPRGLHPNHRNGLVLMPEATWQWILTELPPGPRRRYAAWAARPSRGDGVAQ